MKALKAGAVGCRLYSLVLSAMQAGVDLEVYIEDVLMRVAAALASQIARLTPWAWAKALSAAISRHSAQSGATAPTP